MGEIICIFIIFIGAYAFVKGEYTVSGNNKIYGLDAKILGSVFCISGLGFFIVPQFSLHIIGIMCVTSIFFYCKAMMGVKGKSNGTSGNLIKLFLIAIMVILVIVLLIQYVLN